MKLNSATIVLMLAAAFIALADKIVPGTPWHDVFQPFPIFQGLAAAGVVLSAHLSRRPVDAQRRKAWIAAGGAPAARRQAVTGKQLLAVAVGRPVLAVATLAAGFVLAGEWRAHLDQVATSTALPAHPTKRMERWHLTTFTAPTKAPELPPADLEDARRRWNRPDLVNPPSEMTPPSPQAAVGATSSRAGSIPRPGTPSPPSAAEAPPSPLISGQIQAAGAVLLAEAEDRRPAPAGVEVAAFRETDGRTTLSVRPRPVPFLGLPLRWRADAWTTLAAKPDFGGGVTFLALRVGRITLGPGVQVAQVGGDGRVLLVARGYFDF